MKKYKYYSVLLGFVFLSSCKEKYIPPVIDSNLHYLVVDGSLVNGPDSTIIRLSRTHKLDENPSLNGEQNAQMTVEDEQGNTIYYFQQIDNNGSYSVPGMMLDVNKKYKLRISTTDGKQYLSDDILVNQTPPIDSISWRQKDDGLTIYVNSHDPLNNTKYYQWQYAETYDYYSSNYSELIYVEGAASIDEMFIDRPSTDQVYHCWRTRQSSEILLGSSTNLSEDVISMNAIRFIPRASIELNSTYSILVKQHAITKEGFAYLENIRKINEQGGSLFDVQPSQIPGNIHCITNPGESVIGYLFASTLEQQRIFINNDQVRPWVYLPYCPPPQTVSPDLDSLRYYFGGPSPLRSPITRVYNPLFAGISGSIPACTDCTTKGGTNIRPDFWR